MKDDPTTATTASSSCNETATTDKEQETSPCDNDPSMSLSLFFYWVLPVLCFALFSRYTVDTSIPTIPLENVSRKANFERKRPGYKKPKQPPSSKPTPRPTANDHMPTDWPTAYRTTLMSIESRRRSIEDRRDEEETVQASEASSRSNSQQQHQQEQQSSESDAQPQSTLDDPKRAMFRKHIATLKEQHEANPDHLLNALSYAEAMRVYDTQFHEGGRYEAPCLRLFETVVRLAKQHRAEAIQKGLPTTLPGQTSVQDELLLDLASRSPDGLLCAIYTAYGKALFMANRFSQAVDAYNECLDSELQHADYWDAVNARGSSFLILGKYEEAGRDLVNVIQNDGDRLLFTDAFDGLSRVLQAKEEAVEGGWDVLVQAVDPLIAKLEKKKAAENNANPELAKMLNRLYHAMFLYHDSKTKDHFKAFQVLQRGYEHKMGALPPWQAGIEQQKVMQTMTIFAEGFWPKGMGSPSKDPIFIVGFVRSGSTLLERVLDAHPQIAGTGENSVFNGRLSEIRDAIVKASSESPQALNSVILQKADSVVADMKQRWKVQSAAEQNNDTTEPQRYVDKMLTNYYNLGFIHMIWPNALVLHVVRDPMDTVFSAYKHEFPAGSLDYTSDFRSLAELYQGYRDIMDHWDRVLPGRVTHVRYEDLVHDMPGMARAIVGATGLEWDDSVLDFHSKKHAVNTLSTTQVRKSIYKDALEAWKKYETELQPLVQLLGDRAKTNFKTTLPNYQPPAHDEL